MKNMDAVNKSEEMSKSLHNGAAHAKSKIESKMTEFADQYNLRGVKENVETAVKVPSEFILKHPFASVAIAAFASYLIGSLLGRRSDK